VQVLVPEVSLAYVYSVKPAEFTSIVLPRVALLEARTVALALAAGLVATVLALGVAVAAGVVDEACVADAAVGAGVGVGVELLLPLQAALIDKAMSRPVDAMNKDKRLFIGLLSVLDGQSLRTTFLGNSRMLHEQLCLLAPFCSDTPGYLDNQVPRRNMISKEARMTGRMYS
jgi:hypothetical protein